MLINTGAPRSIKGHAISGGLIALIISGVKNYNQAKQGKITQEEAIKQVIKEGIQGAAISALAIAAANALGEEDSLKGSIKAATYIGTGILASYAIQTFNEHHLDSNIQISGENHE